MCYSKNALNTFYILLGYKRCNINTSRQTGQSTAPSYTNRQNRLPVPALTHLIILALVFMSLAANVFGTNTLTDIYFRDYDIINRTVLVFANNPDYTIERLDQEQVILVTIDDCRKSVNIPHRQQTIAGKVLETIVSEEIEGRTVVSITTRQPYYLEESFLDGDDHKIVLDIYNKQQPETQQEKEAFINFYTSVGYTNRLNALKVNNSPVQNTDNNRQLITLSKNTDFQNAIKIFASIIRDKEGKTLLDMTGITETIGYDIEQLYWRSALAGILKNKNIKKFERDGIYILSRDETVALEFEDPRDNVLIEITFFEADFNVVKEMGIDWSSIVDGKVSIRADIRSTDQLTQDLLTISSERQFTSGGTTVDINTLFKAFSASDKGHIISRPQLTVLSGESGTVQDGFDYTILVPGRSAAGTEIEQAHEVNVQSGTIVDVSPVVIRDKDNEKAIHLTIKVERSTAMPHVTGYSKKTAEVTSQKILYNGEETIVGGLTTKETISVRKGIPFLKDLPWWVLGIRYLTGFNRSQLYNKELVILIKATVMPTIEERKRLRRDVSEDIDQHRRGIEEIEPLLIR